jgi:hypothetical protein
MQRLLFSVLLFASTLAAPVTYILLVVDTWGGSSSVVVKLLICLTVDALAAAVWPGTWIFWIVMHLMGHHTPLALVM